MKISDQQLDKFIAIYEKEFGEVLPRSKAYEKALLVLNYVLICLKRPIENDIVHQPDTD